MTPEGTTETPVPRKPEKPRLRPNEDPAFYEALGRAIKVARAQLGLERKELAEQANVSYAYLSDIETGRGRPSSRSLLKVAEALGRTASELLQEAESYQEFAEMQDIPNLPATGSWFHASPREGPDVGPPRSPSTPRSPRRVACSARVVGGQHTAGAPQPRRRALARRRGHTPHPGSPSQTGVAAVEHPFVSVEPLTMGSRTPGAWSRPREQGAFPRCSPRSPLPTAPPSPSPSS